MHTGRAPHSDQPFGTCPTHGKALYSSRKKARRNASRLHPGEHLSAYPCALGGGWHIGHLPSHICAGEHGREVINNTRTSRSRT